ncbi:MAG: hypothetical protein GDA36_10850 [Rhodobacteraceae bacterium]|nr:hypothetical protein [Paracoccaceae bacterium]
MLLAGLCAAAGIAVFIFVRWRLAVRIRPPHEATDGVMRVVERLTQGNPTDPITRADMHEIADQVRSAVPRAVSTVTLFLTLSFLLVIFGEIILLAQAGMMYVQTRRIEEQNVLLNAQTEIQTAQSEIQTAQFLREGLTSIEQIGTSIEDTRRARQSLDEDFLTPFSIMPDMINDISAATFDEGIRVCFQDDPCPAVPAEMLEGLAGTGQIVVTEGNAGSLRGWYRFTDTLEKIGVTFITSIGADIDSYNEDVDLAKTQLSNIIVNCGGTPEGPTVDRFSAIMGGFLAAIDMWPIEGAEDIQPGRTLAFPELIDQINFLGIAAALGILAESDGKSLEMVSNASDAAEILTSSLSLLETELLELSTSCSSRLQRLEATVEVLQGRTDSILNTFENSSEG